MDWKEFIIKLFQTFVNDKILVIVAVTVVTILCILTKLDSADTIITSAFTGLFGIAVGMSMARRAGDVNGKPEEPPKP
jgi:uncharacterized protein YebE (UPF0316 family)